MEELLKEPALGLRVVVGADLSIPVRGAHTIEIADAAGWLEPGWVMLTTGLRFVGAGDTSREQAELVRALTARGVAALLFGVGVHFKEVPRSLVDAAKEANLTLVSVGADVPFLQVEQFVNRALTSADASVLQQRLTLQNDLLGSLSSNQPVSALIQRLSVLTKGTAVLYEDSGRIVASTGDGPTVLIWSEISTARTTQLRFTVGRWHVSARPTMLRGVGYWVALASRRESVLDELAEPILDATARLLGAIRGIRALGTAQSTAEATQVMRLLDGGVTPDALPRIWERMRPFQFEREHPMRVFVTLQQDPSRERPKALRMSAADPADEAVQLAHDFGLPVLVELDEDSGELSGLVGDRAILSDWSRHLAEAGFHVGLSEPFTDLHVFRARFRDAGRAVRVAQRRAAYPRTGPTGQARATGQAAHMNGSVLLFEDADMVTWLVSSRGSEAFATKARQQFAELLDHEELVETLSMYFSRSMDVKQTAEAMYLHPNSIRYRLRRIQDLIGAPLSSAAVIANLYVALHEVVPERAGTSDGPPGQDDPAASAPGRGRARN